MKNIDDEIPQSKELALDVDRIKKIICQSYNINESELLQSKRGVVNEPRNVAIYLTRRLTGDSLKRIADQYQIQKYSSVSSAIGRMKAMIDADRILRIRIEDLFSLLTKS